MAVLAGARTGRSAWALRAAAAAVAGMTATVVAEDMPTDTGSTVEASSVRFLNGDGSESGLDATWRSPGYGESPGQMVVMVLAIAFASTLIVTYICCHIFRVDDGSKAVHDFTPLPHPVVGDLLKLMEWRRPCVHRIRTQRSQR